MNRKLRIFVTVGVLGSGGAERAAANLASELARRGHDITIGVLRTGGGYTETLHPAVKIHHLRGGRILGEAHAIARYVKAEQPDLVFSPLYETDALVLLSRKLFGWRSKVAICAQNSVFQFAANQVAAARLLIRLEQMLARRGTDQWFAISNGVADEAASFFHVPREAITVIANPVVDLNQPPVTPHDLKALFGPEITKVLLASGRLHKQKDYPTLVKALAIVRAQRPDVGLVILGQGALKPQLEAQIEAAGMTNAVRFPGFQSDPLNWVAGADLFVLSSLWEGLANVLIEALLCGVPIVSTDCPHGPAEVLEDGRYGRLVPPADPQALAGAIIEALDAPHDPEPGRRRAMDFEIGAIADRYEAAFERLFPTSA
jgi:glycosyltransferase involved in cell wall biosynthesis